MPAIIACPSCGGKLRVSDALRGQRVRCPACQHTFDNAAEPASPHAPHDLPLQLAIDDPSSPSPPITSSDTPGLIGAIELKGARSESPVPSTEPPRQAPPPLIDERRHDEDVPDIRQRPPRRDAEPDRGAVVLSLGIISLAAMVVWCAAPLWAILGLAAWIMGQIDLRKMKSGLMDDRGHGMTQAGWICGIIGTVLNGLVMLGCGLYIGGIWYFVMSQPPNTRPIPTMRPAPQRGFPKPVNPPMKKP